MPLSVSTPSTSVSTSRIRAAPGAGSDRPLPAAQQRVDDHEVAGLVDLGVALLRHLPQPDPAADPHAGALAAPPGSVRYSAPFSTRWPAELLAAGPGGGVVVGAGAVRRLLPPEPALPHHRQHAVEARFAAGRARRRGPRRATAGWWPARARSRRRPRPPGCPARPAARSRWWRCPTPWRGSGRAAATRPGQVAVTCSRTAGSSVDTSTLSTQRAPSAASTVQSSSGRPPTRARFLPGIPLLPARTGMTTASVTPAPTARSCPPLQLLALRLLDGQHVAGLVGERLGDVAQVARQLAHPVGLQRRRVVGALAGAVQGEVPLDVLRAERERGDVGGDAQVVPREADGVHVGPVGRAQPLHLQQADVLERHRVARRARVQHEVARACPARGTARRSAPPRPGSSCRARGG